MTSHLKRLLPNLLPNAGTVVVVIFILFTYTAWAAPSPLPSAQSALPAIISYQGTLTNVAGQPISGNTALTFRLYAAPSGGSALWTEAHTGGNAVPVSNGLFNVNLGSLTPIPSAIWKNNPLYLGIQVNSDPEMTPREQLGAVPYAMVAQTAFSVPGENLKLTSETKCLSGSKTLNVSGDWQYTSIPELELTFQLEKPSKVLVSVNGMAQFSNAVGDTFISLLVDNSEKTVASAHGNWGSSSWFNISGQRLVDLPSGPHVLGLKGLGGIAGPLTIHTSTCVSYLVLGQ